MIERWPLKAEGKQFKSSKSEWGVGVGEWDGKGEGGGGVLCPDLSLHAGEKNILEMTVN